jgi:uncharacterized protein YidB (DUF937 family)
MNLSKTLLLGLGALLVRRMLSGGGASGRMSAPQDQGLDPGAPTPDGGSVGGIGGLLEKLQNAGHSDIADSWVGPGQNLPIDPGQLRSALGQKALRDAAQRAGVTEQELLSQLSRALPQFVDKLTPKGRIPSLQEIAATLSQK